LHLDWLHFHIEEQYLSFLLFFDFKHVRRANRDPIPAFKGLPLKTTAPRATWSRAPRPAPQGICLQEQGI